MMTGLEHVVDEGSLRPSTSAEAAERIDRRLRELARCSETASGLLRRFATPAMADAHALLAEWMEEAGMDCRVDAACNLRGRLAAGDGSEGTNPSTLLIGSHCDTVPEAGRFDGALGVVLGIEAVAELRRRDLRLPFALEAVAFSDEEGVRFGVPYLGSRALAGDFSEELLELRDCDECTLRQAVVAFGQDPERMADCALRDRCAGYLEVHIEQGPRLERAGLPLGVVHAIAGQTRASLRFRGAAGHAGTVPMATRQDALAGAAQWIGEVEALARAKADLVATVGALAVAPNVRNVIAAEVSASLDLRCGDERERERATQAVLARAREIAAERGLEVAVERLEEQVAVVCDPGLVARLDAACRGCGIEPIRLVSGAGHDAVPMARIAPVAMLFVRCRGGLSHCPEEHVAMDDLACAFRVLVDTIAAMRPMVPSSKGSR